MNILTILSSIIFGILAIRLWYLSRILVFSKPVLGGLFFEKFVHRFMDPDRGGYKYLISGALEMPHKVYVGNSHNISLKLLAEEQEEITIPDYKYLAGTPHIELCIGIDSRGDNFLEVELQAATATISGERIQRTALPSREMFYRWNCYFQNSGNHEICLILRSIVRSSKDNEPTDIVAEIGSIIKTIKVVKFDGLTQQQVWVLASIFAVISGILAIIKILNDIGIWNPTK